jgi:hypothetical protein
MNTSSMDSGARLGKRPISDLIVWANKSSPRTADNPPPKLPMGVLMPSMIYVSFIAIISCKNKELVLCFLIKNGFFVP